MSLGVGTRRPRRRDPIVNGFTRLSSGLVRTYQGAAPMPVGANSRVQKIHETGIVGGGYVEGFAIATKNAGFYLTDGGMELRNANDAYFIGGVQLDYLSMYGALGTVNGPNTGGGASRIGLEYRNARLRSWGNGVAFHDGYYQLGTPSFQVVEFTDGSGNPDSGATAGKTTTISGGQRMRRRDIEFSRLESNGYVLATIANVGSGYRTDLDVEGNGVFLVPAAVSYPASITYDIYTAAGVLLASLPIKKSYGGDIVTQKKTPAPLLAAAQPYWRVIYDARYGPFLSALSALDFRAVPGGANVAVGGTPIKSSQFDGTYSAAAAFDGNDNTSWSSAGGANGEWIGYQFAAPVSVAEIRIRSRHDASSGPRDFRIQRSADGVHWATTWEVFGQVGWGTGESRVFTKP